jgi:hypothetical protein
MYKYTYRQTKIKTYRYTQTTDRQTENAKVLYWYRLKNRQMCRKTNIHTYYCTYLQYCVYKTDIHTYRQTDRQTGQTEKNDKQTNKPTDREYMNVIRDIKKVGDTYPCKVPTGLFRPYPKRVH